MIFNTGLIFTPEVFTLCKKVSGLHHNRYIIELIPLEFLVQIRSHEKEEDTFELSSEIKIEMLW